VVLTGWKEEPIGSGGPEPATYCVPEARRRARYRFPAPLDLVTGYGSHFSNVPDATNSSIAARPSNATARTAGPC
jgi:hypothetical protein